MIGPRLRLQHGLEGFKRHVLRRFTDGVDPQLPPGVVKPQGRLRQFSLAPANEGHSRACSVDEQFGRADTQPVVTEAGMNRHLQQRVQVDDRLQRGIHHVAQVEPHRKLHLVTQLLVEAVGRRRYRQFVDRRHALLEEVVGQRRHKRAFQVGWRIRDREELEALEKHAGRFTIGIPLDPATR